jgi:beta-phosphoglucomutase-like phosphatase (HAD superfamily)
MTFAISNMPNNELHVHYRALCEVLKAAEAIADTNAEAEHKWGEAWDRWADAMDFMWLKPVESFDDIDVKFEIIAYYEERFLGSIDMIAKLREQIASWRHRRG